MTKDQRLIFQTIGTLEMSSFENIHKASGLSYNETYWALKGCERHKYVSYYCGQYEYTDAGITAYRYFDEKNRPTT